MNENIVTIAPEDLDEKVLDVAVTDRPKRVPGEGRRSLTVEPRAWTLGGQVD